MSTTKFFRKSDWYAFLATFLVSLIVYVLTLQPTVGLEDSGELVVASDYLGVPHPPGYPSWSVLTWFFQWIFHGATFHGHPNPAWAVNLFSAVAGAAACGVLAMLISRSGMELLRSLSKESNMLGEKTESLFCAVAGISGGLLLAFGQGMWSQSVIAEVYSLNILFQTLMLVFLFRWTREPASPKWLYACAFTFGLGCTNHQTLMFMGLAIAVAIFCNDYNILTWEFLFFLVATVLGILGVWQFMSSNTIVSVAEGAIRPPFKGLNFALSLLCFVGSGVACHYKVKRQLLMVFFAILALLFAAYGVMFGMYTLFAIGVGCSFAVIFMQRDHTLFRDFFIAGIAFVILVGMNEWASSSTGHQNMAWEVGPAQPGFWIWTIYAVLIPIIATFALPNGRVVGPTILLMFIGVAFYLYMPISSDQNPPINWGYPRTWQGFMHAITRGQYEQVKLAHVFTLHFLKQVGAYLRDLRAQFYWPVALLAAIPFLFTPKLGRKNNSWLATTLTGFLFVSLVFMILLNPKTDIQSLFIGRTQFIQSHALYAIWIGYGLLLIMAYLETLVRNNPFTKIGGVVMVLLLPFALVYKNYYSERQLTIVGGSEQNGHDFGWQFGNWQLQGVNGIEEDLRAWYSPEEFEKIWATYPNKNYPEPMGTNAIFFGGTDPGRFVPTYMIYSAKVRPDVYLITQNALADNTYMNVMRDLYGDQIWIPSPLDSNLAFQMYLQENGKNANVEGGRVQVQGVQAVMEINGYLTKMIFDHNQYRTETKTDERKRPVGSAVVYENPYIDPETGLPPERTFYVEESYALQWMYPYLTPHGLIMKINNKPTPLTAEMIKNDTDFWKWYCERLLNDEKFIRDVVARKTFSKLRSSIAGLYAARNKPREAEAAFRQAVALYDLSPEANYRLADLLAREGRFDEAIALFDTFMEKDPNNEQADTFRAQLKKRQQMSGRKQQLEQKLRGGSLQLDEVQELCSIYLAMGQISQADSLALHLLGDSRTTPEMVMQIIQLMAQHRRYGVVEQALKRYTALKPNDPSGWINLAALQLGLNKQSEMWTSIDKAIEVGGDAVRNMLRADKRFNPIRNTAEFQRRVQGNNMDMKLLPGF